MAAEEGSESPVPSSETPKPATYFAPEGVLSQQVIDEANEKMDLFIMGLNPAVYKEPQMMARKDYIRFCMVEGKIRHGAAARMWNNLCNHGDIESDSRGPAGAIRCLIPLGPQVSRIGSLMTPLRRAWLPAGGKCQSSNDHPEYLL